MLMKDTGLPPQACLWKDGLHPYSIRWLACNMRQMFPSNSVEEGHAVSSYYLHLIFSVHEQWQYYVKNVYRVYNFSSLEIFSI